MHWRLIPLKSYDASLNMAIDHALFESVAKGISPPTIRFYWWKGGGVSIGKGQNAEIINLKNCLADGVGLVRRPTGGNALFHNQEDFTYSVCAPNYIFSRSEQKGRVNLSAYKEICRWIIRALGNVGIKGILHGSNNVMVDGKKISGNAQLNIGKAFLQHGSLFFSAKTELWGKYLHVPGEKLECITGVQKFERISPSFFYKALLESFSSNRIVREAKPGTLSPQEAESAKMLASTVYSRDNFFGTTSKRKGDICAIDTFNT
ncbi:lipoate--protein ligase family protein [Candidatus Woesearchaeota archaeon]|nr:lipoate--protein ligase family protein [Candidatus Woesearchaeota archaeon]